MRYKKINAKRMTKMIMNLLGDLWRDKNDANSVFPFESIGKAEEITISLTQLYHVKITMVIDSCRTAIGTELTAQLRSK